MEEKEKVFRLLVINPGSTSTKVSLFDNEKCLFERSLFHDAPELLKYPHVNDQMLLFFFDSLLLYEFEKSSAKKYNIEYFYDEATKLINKIKILTPQE